MPRNNRNNIAFDNTDEEGGGCCKGVLTLLSIIFEMVAFGFLGFGVALKYKNDDFVLMWILIIQGLLMLTVGTCGFCCVCRKNRSGLKGFAILLAVLALADIVIGIVLLFICNKNCPEVTKKVFSSEIPLVEGMFFGTAVLLIIAMVSSISLHKRKRRVNVEFAARFSAVS